MPDGLLPSPAAGATDLEAPQAVAEAFLAAMAANDADGALALVADDILYVNVGLPPIRGRRGVEKVLRLLDRPGVGFEVYLHSIAVDGDAVLTERTDVLLKGRFRAQFWVWGRFDVRDGQIVLWRDSFDFWDLLKANLRGLAGLVLPSLRPEPPRSLDVPPGR